MYDEADTPVRMEGALDFALALTTLAAQFIRSEVINIQSRETISAMFLARAAQSMRSLCLLSEAGLVGDAMTVGRTVVELDIEHAFIMASDTEHRWKCYAAFDAVSTRKLIVGIEAMRGGVDPAILESIRQRAAAARQLSGDKDSWAGPGSNLRTRAHAVGRVHQYDVAYRDMCGASHGGSTTLWYANDSAVAPVRFFDGPRAPKADAIGMAAASFVLLLTTAFEKLPRDGLSAPLASMVGKLAVLQAAYNPLFDSDNDLEGPALAPWIAEC